MNAKKNQKTKSILIIGMSGGLAKITTKKILDKFPHAEICGVDSRNLDTTNYPENVNFIQMKYTRGNFEKLFREKKFDTVFHLARMSHSSANPMITVSKRLDLNLMGTRRILDLSLKFNVKRIIILSTYHVYGALPENPVYLKEDSALKASIKYPELRDVVEMDQMATSWMWKNKEAIETVILRPCNVIGPRLNNTITEYLTANYAPIGIDFNPMFQFIHEEDMSNVLCQSIESISPGIYNVAHPETIPLREAKKITSDGGIPTLLFALEKIGKIIKQVWTFPDYLIHYLMYPCIIDSSPLFNQLSEDFQFTSRQALEDLKSIED